MSEGPLLGPGTVTWKVNREPVVLMGGGRALLLQVAHPLVAAGVSQHSNYEADPWGRLFRTLDTTFKIAFGDPDTSARASKRLIRRHDSVKGVSDDGVPYDAQDPDLLIWVWTTLVDTSLLLYERCLKPLPDDERERFYQEQKLFAYACGVPEGACPERHGDFQAYWERMLREELRVTDGARAVAHSIANPAVPRPLRPAMAPNTLVTAGLLPELLRVDYGFDWGPRQERLLRLMLGAARLGGRVVPRRIRELPAQFAASERRRPLSRGTDRAEGRAPTPRTRTG